MLKSGFTLIELLIVLAVISALLGIVTPNAIGAVARAKATQVALNLRNLKSAVEQCIIVEGNVDSCDSIAKLVNKGHISSSPGDDYKIGEVNKDDVISVWIGYKGEVDGDKIFQIYNAVTTDCAQHFNNDDSYKACVEARM